MVWSGDTSDREFPNVREDSRSVCGCIGVVTGLIGNFLMWKDILGQCVNCVWFASFFHHIQFPQGTTDGLNHKEAIQPITLKVDFRMDGPTETPSYGESLKMRGRI